ncbi:hypothetical protein [Halostagnicola sp. A-GB9-2]|uniref:hypothetical protein n=1 Tax=Halostagnicola sp. A-GB9-2 TaxID=3048066 RepID=UPI0024BF112C|nr:hypothetical protein [Halostagnicola sp. A-GB9-2]MDJ1432620.1 hypothetical protein [Halostagnicola sp. A-GB9-2]
MSGPLTDGGSGRRFPKSEFVARVDQFEHIGFEELLAETNAEVDVQDRSSRESYRGRLEYRLFGTARIRYSGLIEVLTVVLGVFERAVDGRLGFAARSFL